MLIKKLLKICFAVAIVCLPSLVAEAAVLSLEPSGGQYGAGDTFGVDIKINLEENEECVNTVEAYINFSNDLLTVVDFSTGESILSLWLKKPATGMVGKINRQGQIYFAGGAPGGYCGRIPGDPGISNIVGKIIFKVNELRGGQNIQPTAKVYFHDKTRVLLNDGLGTEAGVDLRGAEFNITERSDSPKKEWEARLREDNIPPNPFVIELHQDQNIFDGKYFIIFSTTDKQTGIDRYEVLETGQDKLPGQRPKRSFFDTLFGKKDQEPSWKQANIPYLLEDQSLRSVIKVKAVDKAGNERIQEYIPSSIPAPPAEIRTSHSLVIMILLIIIGIALISWLVIRRRLINKI